METNTNEFQAFDMMNIALKWFRDTSQGEASDEWKSPKIKHIDLTGQDLVYIGHLDRSKSKGENYDWARDKATGEIQVNCEFSINKMLAHEEVRTTFACG